jgi:AcrR family transcriptional regulator
MSTTLPEPPAGGARARRERGRREMREAILAAARALVEAEGAGALGVRPIARRLGYSAPALYEYVSGKAAVCDLLYIDGFHRLAAALADSAARESDPLLRLWAVAGALWSFALSHPQLYLFMAARPVPDYTPSAEASAAAEAALGVIEQAAAALIASGRWRARSAREPAVALWAVAHGFISLRLASGLTLLAGAGGYAGLYRTTLSAVLDAYERA